MKDIRKPPSIYVETSVWSMLETETATEKSEITKLFIKKAQSRSYNLYISSLVVEEIERTNNVIKRAELIRNIENSKPILLEESVEAEELSDVYIENKIIPVRYRIDALHIAYAVVYNLSVIVSWNMEHIVRHKTRQEVNGINKVYGFQEIDICTPEEVI